MSYKLTKDQLFFDLYAAFLCAKKHKSNKDYGELLPPKGGSFLLHRNNLH